MKEKEIYFFRYLIMLCLFLCFLVLIYENILIRSDLNENSNTIATNNIISNETKADTSQFFEGNVVCLMSDERYPMTVMQPIFNNEVATKWFDSYGILHRDTHSPKTIHLCDTRIGVTQ